MEHDPGRHEDDEAGCLGEQPHEPGCGGGEVLEVVEDEQELAVGDGVEQRGLRVPAGVQPK
jgi:hypothetical protein